MPSQPLDREALSRRAVLRTGGLAAGVVAASTLLGGTRAAHAAEPEPEPLDFSARETFDLYDRQFHEGGGTGQPDDTNEAGALAWGQSYVLIGFVRMYEAYHDTYYLDRLIHNADQVLANRDSERGVTDHRGLSLPAWRAANPYTVAAVELPDETGRPVLEFRSARSGPAGGTVTVTHDDDGTGFSIAFAHPSGTSIAYEHLTMGTAVSRIYSAYAGTTMCTAKALGAERPAAGTYTLVTKPVIFSVHTGMIAYPLASFARIVQSTPRLRANRHYRAKAAEYAEAVAAALAVHDEEWVQDGGRGYYRWLKGTPLPYDGNPVPINQSTAIGRAQLELGAAIGGRRGQDYTDRAARLARMFRAQITKDAGGSALWSYWPTDAPIWAGYAATGDPATDVSLYTPTYGSASGGAQQLDDCSHAAISVDFAGLARQCRVVMTDGDMHAIGRTFGENLATTGDDGVPTVFTYIDGTGVAPSGQYLQAPRWIRAAWWDSRAYSQSSAIYQARQPAAAFGSGLCAVASLNWYARQGSRPLPKI